MIYGVSKRELVNVLCEVEANPVDVEFKWTFNNSAELIRFALLIYGSRFIPVCRCAKETLKNVMLNSLLA
jgi:hypothetical protein